MQCTLIFSQTIFLRINVMNMLGLIMMVWFVISILIMSLMLLGIYIIVQSFIMYFAKNTWTINIFFAKYVHQDNNCSYFLYSFFFVCVSEVYTICLCSIGEKYLEIKSVQTNERKGMVVFQDFYFLAGRKQHSCAPVLFTLHPPCPVNHFTHVDASVFSLV